MNFYLVTHDSAPRHLPHASSLHAASGTGHVNASAGQGLHAIAPGNSSGSAGGNFYLPGNGQVGGLAALNSHTAQLPSAFMLPTGQLIPVVSNPQLIGAAGQAGSILAPAPIGANPLAAQLHLPQLGPGVGSGAGQV